MALVLDTEYVEPAELTGYTREALADLPQNQFGLLQDILPNVLVDDIEFRTRLGGNGLARAAKYRSWDTEAPLGRRRGFEDLSGAIPPISQKIRLSEYDRLKLRRNRDAIIDAIYDDAVEQAIAIDTRIAIAKGQLLSTGMVTLHENGLVLEVDFERKATHNTTAPVLWNVDGSDPIEDLLAAQAVYVATNGVRPGRFVTDQSVISTLMRNATIRAMTLPAGSTTQIVTVDAVAALLRSFGLPELEIFEAQVEGDDGNPLDLLPKGRILFLPPAGRKVGESLWGITAEAMDEDYGIDQREAPGIVVGSYSDKDPVSKWTKASAVALPVAPGINLTLSLRVL